MGKSSGGAILIKESTDRHRSFRSQKPNKGSIPTPGSMPHERGVLLFQGSEIAFMVNPTRMPDSRHKQIGYTDFIRHYCYFLWRQSRDSPLIDHRFTRSEFLRGVKNISDEDARKQLMPMNCISWNIGHLAWQEQRYFLYYAQGQMPFPDINTNFAFGAPGSTPSLRVMLQAWRAITAAADPWLDSRPRQLLNEVYRAGKPAGTSYGNLLQRIIYHYWYHTDENAAIRQMLGHTKLPVFVGNIDSKAPYRPESSQYEQAG